MNRALMKMADLVTPLTDPTDVITTCATSRFLGTSSLKLYSSPGYAISKIASPFLSYPFYALVFHSAHFHSLCSLFLASVYFLPVSDHFRPIFCSFLLTYVYLC